MVQVIIILSYCTYTESQNMLFLIYLFVGHICLYALIHPNALYIAIVWQIYLMIYSFQLYHELSTKSYIPYSNFKSILKLRTTECHLWERPKKMVPPVNGPRRLTICQFYTHRTGVKYDRHQECPWRKDDQDCTDICSLDICRNKGPTWNPNLGGGCGPLLTQGSLPTWTETS